MPDDDKPWPTHRACHRCGEALVGEYWIEDRHLGVHTQCSDWSRRPFIFERQLKLLTRRRTEPGVVEVLNWLLAARSKWPADAAAVVEEGLMRLRGVRVR